nr:uncharacterized mitochondrial protein AtMg00810-like [Tanacetum cinerariifolium]
MKTQKPLLKDEDGEDVDVHMYRYLKGQPKLGLWYSKDSLFDLVAYIDSDYVEASLDRKPTTGGCQFLGCRLISWQCKKQTLVLNSTTEAKYVAASSCCGQVLWIQNQLLGYGKSKEKCYINDEKAFWNGIEVNTVGITYYCWVNVNAVEDGKKIIITETYIIRGLQLAGEEGVDCLPNSKIFEQLALIGTMASAIICLATNQKFNFSKWIFDSMIRNLDNVSGKFLMYPRVGKGFSRRVTPLFPTMVEDYKKGHSVPQPSDPIDHDVDETVHKELEDNLVRAATIASSLELEQDIRNINKTQSKATPNESSSQRTNSCGGPRVIELENTKTTQSNEIACLKRRVKKLEKRNKSRTHKLKRFYKVGLTVKVESSYNEEILEQEVVKDVNENVVEEVVNAAHDSTTTTTLTTEEITLAQALEALKISKPKVKGIAIHKQEELSKSTATIPKQQSQDKGKWIMIEKHMKPKKKDQIRLDEEATKRVNTFEEFRPELVERNEKRVGKELIQESTKKKKVDDDKEKAELKQLMVTIPDEEKVAIDVIPLAVKSPNEVWKTQQGYKVLEWKLYDSCGVNSLRMKSMQIYMLVEKKYPLTPHTLSMMLEKKLQIGYETGVSAAYELQ